MSKLYDNYLSLKSNNSSIIYLFKAGAFYIFLDKDAEFISNKFNFKLTNLNSSIVKCGFPVSRIQFYTNLFKDNNISFKIIDSTYSTIENYTDYLNNTQLKTIINNIIDIDFDNITFKQCYETLFSISENLKQIYRN